MFIIIGMNGFVFFLKLLLKSWVVFLRSLLLLSLWLLVLLLVLLLLFWWILFGLLICVWLFVRLLLLKMGKRKMILRCKRCGIRSWVLLGCCWCCWRRRGCRCCLVGWCLFWCWLLILFCSIYCLSRWRMWWRRRGGLFLGLCLCWVCWVSCLLLWLCIFILLLRVRCMLRGVRRRVLLRCWRGWWGRRGMLGFIRVSYMLWGLYGICYNGG